MSTGESQTDPLERDPNQFPPEQTVSRTRSHSVGSVSFSPSSLILSSQQPAVEDTDQMDSGVATPRKSDPHVVKFKPCLVLRPSSSSSPRSPATRLSGYRPFVSSLTDPTSDFVTNGCLSDPLPIGTADLQGNGSCGASAAVMTTTSRLSSSLKPCRSVGRAHRTGFSSPPPPPSSMPLAVAFEPRRRHSYMELMKKRASQSRSPPPPASVVRALGVDAVDTLLNDDGDEDEDEVRPNAYGQGRALQRPYCAQGDNCTVFPEQDDRLVTHDGTPPLAQAVVAALKHHQHQHHLFRSTTNTTTTATTTSTASSSRFSPVYLSDENEAVDVSGVTHARRHTEDALQIADSDTDDVSYGDDDEEDKNNQNTGTRSAFEHKDETTVEPDGESGYGASCSSSSVRLFRFGSRRDKRRQKRRIQRRMSVGTSTAETHSSPGDEGDEDGVHSEVTGDSTTGRHTPNIPSMLTAAASEFGDLGSSARRLIPSRTASNRHKRNRVRILDNQQQQDQVSRNPIEHSVSRNRHRIHVDGFHSCGEAVRLGDDDDNSESPERAHTQSSLPSYPCCAHRYSIDTGSAPSIHTSDTEANRAESDAFDAVVEASPVLNLTMPGLAPGAAMPPPPNAVPSASILVMSTNSQTHYTASSFSPFTSMSSSNRGVLNTWHPDISPNAPLAHCSAYHPDGQPDTLHYNSTNHGPAHVPPSCLGSIHAHEHYSGCGESSICSYCGPSETSSAFHPASSGARSMRRASNNPPTPPLGWAQPPCPGAHPSPSLCSYRPSTSCSTAFKDEVRSSSPQQQQQQHYQIDTHTSELLDHSTGPTSTMWYDSMNATAVPQHSNPPAWGMMPLRARTSPGYGSGPTRSQRLAESGRSHSAMEQRRYSAPCPEPIYEVNLASPINPLSHTPGSTRVSLVVDNVRFIVDAQLLQAHPDTMLGRMISSHFAESSRLAEACTRDQGASSVPGTSNPHPDQRPHPPDILVAQNSNISAHLFRAVLDYYLLGHMCCPPGVPVQELKETCDYFLIPFNHHTVRCGNLRAFLHELSNDGARANFAEFLETHILSLLVKCAQTGQRECHVVIVTDDETIVWDPEFPPQMPENELQSHIIYSTHMFRFLKYIENREVAKQVLIERGLKKIRIGIEGYPTCKDRMKFRPGLRPEAIYNYVQCPFLRMSWEEEENKSRHVDFQCVKSKSVSDLTTGLEQAVVDPLPPPHLIRSPLRLSSPERREPESASFAAQVDSLDPDGPLILDGASSSPLADALDQEDPSPSEPRPPGTLADSPILEQPSSAPLEGNDATQVNLSNTESGSSAPFDSVS